MKTLPRKPGDFHAVCRLTRAVPERKMTPDLWGLANAAGFRREFKEMSSERVDQEKRRHGRWEIVFAACDGFETSDREAYLKHMAVLHNRKPGGPRQIKLGQGHWHAPALTEDGLPFKDRDGVTETCSACGLVSEVRDHAAELWCREHQERCVGAERGAA